MAKAKASIHEATAKLLALGWTEAQIEEQLEIRRATRREKEKILAGDEAKPGMI